VVATESQARPKELVRPMPLDWWLRKPAYTWFMIRDVTSVFIAGYCVFLLVVLHRAGQGESAFRQFYEETLRSPLSLVLHLVALVFAVYHSVTFFNLTPRVLVLFRGDEKVPDGVIAGAHHALWAVVSLILLIIALVV
jgi:fumarate reductase subunit C